MLDGKIFDNIMTKMKKSKISVEKATMSFKNTPLHTALQLYNYFVKSPAPKASEMCNLLKKMVNDLVSADGCCRLLVQTNDMNIAPIQIIMNFDVDYFKELLKIVKENDIAKYEEFIQKKRLYMIKSNEENPEPTELTFEEYYRKIGKNDVAGIFSSNSCKKCGNSVDLEQCANCLNKYCTRHIQIHKCIPQ